MFCAVPGCTATAKRFGRYCDTHAARDRRHGHPRQQAIRAAELRPYREMVRRRVQKNADAAVWQTLEDTWRQAVQRCQDRLQAYQAGKPVNRWQLRAWQEVIKLAQQVEPREVIETTAAMYVMFTLEPRRFRSDRAFWFQLVRRVRALGDVNVGSWFDGRTGKVKRVYRDLPPRACEALAKVIVESIGIVGMRLAKLEQQERRREADQRAQLYRELEEVV